MFHIIFVLVLIFSIYWVLFGRKKHNRKVAHLEDRFDDILKKLVKGTSRKQVERMFSGFKCEKRQKDRLVYSFMYEINGSVKQGKVIYLYFRKNFLADYDIKERTRTTTHY